MAYILACLMASFSFLVNRRLAYYMGPKIIIGLGPILEETAKTLPAYFLHVDILLVHTVFGLLEAGYDFRQSERHKLSAAFVSIAGHYLFGWVSIAFLELTGTVWSGLAGGCVVHLAWNVFAVNFFPVREGRKH